MNSSATLTLAEYRHSLRHDLTSFVQCAFYELNPERKYVHGRHIDVIISKLEACRRGEIRRLIINLPPRNLKSHCISVSFVAWLLGHDPSLQIICASYGQELADKLARDTRNVMQSSWYHSLFPTRLGERQAVYDFSTDGMGGRMATSVGGVLTGRGADFIILDDPLKPDEALSASQRGAVNDWFDHTLLSRLNNKATGCIIIVMQRLHQDDLCGHVLEQEDWEILSFPAIAVDHEYLVAESPLGSFKFERNAGEALHPEWESLESLVTMRASIGEYNFQSQYQQSPVPPGGSMVKLGWLKYYELGSEPDRFRIVIQSWDTANKSGELNDFSVCTTWGVRDQNYYLLHVYRKRLNYPDLRRAAIELRKTYRAYTVLIEDKASGTQLIQDLKEANIYAKPYLPPPGSDKIMRLHSQSICFESGRVFIPNGEAWVPDYVAEITGFPGTRHDDQVDSTTQFLDYIRSPGSMPMRIHPDALRMAAQPTRWTRRYR